jgi:hypothetical protein
MPKRRMTMARLAQIAAWRMAGSRVRRGLLSPTMWDGSKIAPMGKNVRLYHRTTSYRARSIVKYRNFKPAFSQKPLVFFSHGGVTPEEHVKGQSVLSVSVPRSKISREFYLGQGIGYYMINQKDVQGLKVTRVK